MLSAYGLCSWLCSLLIEGKKQTEYLPLSLVRAHDVRIFLGLHQRDAQPNSPGGAENQSPGDEDTPSPGNRQSVCTA